MRQVILNVFVILCMVLCIYLCIMQFWISFRSYSYKPHELINNTQYMGEINSGEKQQWLKAVNYMHKNNIKLKGFYHTSCWKPYWRDVLREQLLLLDGMRSKNKVSLIHIHIKLINRHKSTFFMPSIINLYISSGTRILLIRSQILIPNICFKAV